MPLSKLKLYDLDGCPYCKMVRDHLFDLGLDYEKVPTPSIRRERHEVFKVSGQYLVPVLVDGDEVIEDEVKIIRYLNKKYTLR